MSFWYQNDGVVMLTYFSGAKRLYKIFEKGTFNLLVALPLETVKRIYLFIRKYKPRRKLLHLNFSFHGISRFAANHGLWNVAQVRLGPEVKTLLLGTTLSTVSLTVSNQTSSGTGWAEKTHFAFDVV